MTNNQLTDEQVVTLQLRIMSALSFYRQRPEKEAKAMTDLLMLSAAAASELQERRKADTAPAGYFAFDNDGGFTNHDTAESARSEAQSAIEYFRGDACDGWPDEVSSVCWGVIMQQSTKAGERPVEEGDKCSSHIECVCDYVLLPELQEKPE